MVRLQFWQVSRSYKLNAVWGKHGHFNVIFKVAKESVIECYFHVLEVVL